MPTRRLGESIAEKRAAGELPEGRPKKRGAGNPVLLTLADPGVEKNLAKTLAPHEIGVTCNQSYWALLPSIQSPTLSAAKPREGAMRRFFSTTKVARRTGTCRQHIWRQCRKHPGFAIRVEKALRIPEAHVDRLEQGETIAAIAANPSRIHHDDVEATQERPPAREGRRPP
jgi:hypothetical protein